MSEARSRSNNPPCAADSGQNRAVVFAPRGRGRLPVIEGTDFRETSRGACLSWPL